MIDDGGPDVEGPDIEGPDIELEEPDGTLKNCVCLTDAFWHRLYAGMAMQGIVVATHFNPPPEPIPAREDLCRCALAWADDMLAARQKEDAT